ncbi:cytochrome P450 [Streptomyces sp. ODS28]|uniref:cytochrome P450 n=1 Tax=Streptomyces sp. ODS28 TaxID=3136688 RepID=UPI0031E59086
MTAVGPPVRDAGAGVPDVFDPRIYASGIPHASFARLREEHPVAWQPEHPVLDWPAGPGFWAVTRHADAVRVLRSSGDFSSYLGATQIRDPDPADLPFIRRMMLNQDPPRHGRLRTLVSRAFTPRRVERFEAAVRERARQLLGAARAEGSEVDLVRAVTDEYALLNLADLLGVPPGDRGLLLEWTERIIGYQDPEQAVVVRGPDGRPADPRSPAMLEEMFAYARELAAHKREHPADDVMTALARELAGPGLEPELEMFFFLLTVAGNDTVRSAAPGGFLALAGHPDAQRELRERAPREPRFLARAVEELLRWHPPVLSFRRTAARDTEVAGRRIAEGDKVVVFHASANFDERVFAAPQRLDLARDPNPHIAFGEGPHVCLGAHFARLQLRVLHEEALRILPPYEQAGPERRLVSNFINGLHAVPVRFRT